MTTWYHVGQRATTRWQMLWFRPPTSAVRMTLGGTLWLSTQKAKEKCKPPKPPQGLDKPWPSAAALARVRSSTTSKPWVTTSSSGINLGMCTTSESGGAVKLDDGLRLRRADGRPPPSSSLWGLFLVSPTCPDDRSKRCAAWKKTEPREPAITQLAKLESIKLLIAVYPPLWVRNSSGAVQVNGQVDGATCTTAAKPL